MLPSSFKRKFRIVLAGKTIFKQQRGDVGTFFVILIMATIIGGSYFLVNGTPPKFLVQDPLDPDKNTTYSLNEKKIAKGKKNTLQLKDIPFVSNTPTPMPGTNEPGDRPEPTRRQGDDDVVITQGPTQPPDSGNPDTSCGIADPSLITGQRPNGSCCVEDGPVNNASDCCEGVPTCREIMDNPDKFSSGSNQYFWDMDPEQAKLWCNAKPIIYLYPTQPTFVDVRVEASGPIVISNPLYPVDGWKNVLAHPDGTLVYNGREYKELFYEAAIPPNTPPKNGIIVKTSDLKKTLSDLVARLGLRGFEKEEFVSFWTEKLGKEDAPYMLISLFPHETKETFDRVIISPTPDTFIQFIAYVKPPKDPCPTEPLVLRDNPPKGVGFTAVEWGGILDN